MIVVFEAPIFQQETINAKVVDRVKKGKIIHIHPQHFSSSESEVETKSDFYRTFDSNGQDAYILKEHVMLITNDTRESPPAIDNKNDPTDFRLAEPLPENYPYYDDKHNYNLAISIGTKSELSDLYIPKPSIDQRESGMPVELNLIITYAPTLFGVTVVYAHQTNKYLLIDGTTTTEKYRSLGIGPYFSVALWRKLSHNLYTFFSPLFYFYNKIQLNSSYQSINSAFDNTYQNRHLAIRGGIYYQYDNLFPGLNTQLGINMEVSCPRTVHAIKSTLGAFIGLEAN
ncbi:MAG: hypothetical protein HQK53_15600 [Oligoflexia bacterium]|nr:hypothetical protein [Oligoflexia bacterium]